MPESSASSTGPHAGLTGRLLSAARPIDWGTIAASVRGPLLSVAAVVLLDMLRRHDIMLPSPFAILFLAIVYAAYTGGLRPALVSVAITVLYALHYLSEPGLPLRYTGEHAAGVVAVAAASLLAAILVARLHARIRGAEALELTRADAEALARRFGMLEQASLILTSPRDFDTTFRDFARLIVPTLADWCTVHLGSGDAELSYVAGAHRDAAKDLVVRALAEYGDRRPPFEELPLAQVVQISERTLRTDDPEKAKLYRALSTTAVLRLPVEAGGARVALVTLGMIGETRRRFAPDDVMLAEEIGEAVGLALENVRLRDQAQDAERRAGLVFDAHPQPMWIFDVDTLGFLAVNQATIQTYGWTREEFLGMTIMDLLAPEDAAPATPVTAERAAQRGEAALAHHQRRDGTVIEMELVSHEFQMGGRRARLVLASDISDRTRTRAALHESEDQLRLAQRSEASGRIAGAVAHDFNNVLTTIRGFGEMLLLDMVPDDRRRHDVQRICQAADRGALLTRQLLAFGRNHGEAPRAVDLNDVLRSLEPLARRLVGADVQLEVRLAPALGQVRIDPAQLEHILVNLMLAARDAMPAGGRLTLETGERRISSMSRGRPVRPGRYVVLEVSDTGQALDAETRDLGRSIVFGIVRQFGGVVRVASEPGVGTTVKVYLPRLESEAAESLDEAEQRSLRGVETVLVAEDEEGVRELLRKTLTEYGYTVLAARHGRDALLLAGEQGDRIDLLVTDIVMPEMSGRELAETLIDRRPDLKILYISGYTDDEVLQRGVRGREVGLLRKPFATEELARRVRIALDGG
ncbi:MAG TPA: response regulator [Gemmatimonadales bacterium]|nr:response regulator [Gemmatimonadales bacterium]